MSHHVLYIMLALFLLCAYHNWLRVLYFLYLVCILKVWDVNMESRPVEVYPVHDYLRSRLCTLYEKDSIFDRFECGWNGDDSYPNQSCRFFLHTHAHTCTHLHTLTHKQLLSRPIAV